MKSDHNNFQINFKDTYKIYLPQNMAKNSRYSKEISVKTSVGFIVYFSNWIWKPPSILLLSFNCLVSQCDLKQIINPLLDWLKYPKQSRYQQQIRDVFVSFLQYHFLFWLEAQERNSDTKAWMLAPRWTIKNSGIVKENKVPQIKRWSTSRTTIGKVSNLLKYIDQLTEE